MPGEYDKGYEDGIDAVIVWLMLNCEVAGCNEVLEALFDKFWPETME